MRLYNFFRSGTSHRLRIALNLKGLQYEYRAIDLQNGEHQTNAFRTLSPQGLVPALETEGDVFIQTPAILEWLEERHPEPPLLPSAADDRARVRALAAIVGCDVHPLNNRRVLEYLRKHLNHEEQALKDWATTWITAGFDALELILASDTVRRDFCFGSTPSLADVYLVPQVESARRFSVDLRKWPHIAAVDRACEAVEAFRKAAPAWQPDAR